MARIARLPLALLRTGVRTALVAFVVLNCLSVQAAGLEVSGRTTMGRTMTDGSGEIAPLSSDMKVEIAASLGANLAFSSGEDHAFLKSRQVLSVQSASSMRLGAPEAPEDPGAGEVKPPVGGITPGAPVEHELEGIPTKIVRTPGDVEVDAAPSLDVRLELAVGEALTADAPPPGSRRAPPVHDGVHVRLGAPSDPRPPAEVPSRPSVDWPMRLQGGSRLPVTSMDLRGSAGDDLETRQAEAGVVRSLSAPAPVTARSSGGGWVAVAAAIALGSLALSHRQSRQEILDHPVRERLLRELKRFPGASALDLASATGCSYASTRYHLDKLERATFIVRQDTTRPVRYFTAGFLREDDRLGIAVLRGQGAARVMALIARNPGMTKADLGRVTGLGGPTIAWHVERLMAAGLIEAGKAGRRMPLTPAADRMAAITHAVREEPLPAPQYDETESGTPVVT